MENKKDIQGYTTGKAQELTNEQVSKLSPFGVNHACGHAYKRTERILLALYLVTNFVPENEPARLMIRDKSLRILSDILSLRSGFRSAGSGRVDSVIALIHENLSLLEVIYAGGFISNMNREVLKQEFVNLILFLRSVEDGAEAESLELGDAYFKDTDEQLHGQQLNKKDNVFYNKKTNIQRTQSQQKPGTTSKGQKGFAERHVGRRDEILSIIKDKKSVSIKDIASIVTGCSEKTLQRELIALVTEGVLKKEGERRWSTYLLV